MSEAPPGPNLVDAEPRPIGGSGLSSGPLALGLWRFVHPDVASARALVEVAVDHGLTLLDTADVYGLDWGGAGWGASEELLGRVLADAPHLRDRVAVATKGGIRPPTPYDSSATWLRQACDASLTRLGVDVIDLYQVHRPDLFTHPADVHRAGKVRAVGVSNHTPAQTEALVAHLSDAGLDVASVQPEYSVAELGALRDGTLDVAMRSGAAVLAWSPLAGGRVATGDGLPTELVAALDRLAEREGVSRTAVAVAFVLAHPSRPVAIVGSQRPERIAELAAATGVHLDRGDVYRLIESSEGVALP